MKEEKKYEVKPDSVRHLDINELAQYAEFLRGDRDAVPEELLLHVEECALCRAEAMEVADIVDLTDDGRPTTDVGHRSSVVRLLPSVVRLLAAIAAVALIAWVIQQLRPEKPEPERMATVAADSTPLTPSTSSTISSNSTISTNSTISAISTDSTPVLRQPGRPPVAPTGTKPDTVRYAQAFVPNPTLEQTVGAMYRSGTDPKAIGPGPETIFTSRDTLTISWTPDPYDSYLLEIVDNKGTKIIEVKPEASNQLKWETNLKPGLYYWKFLGKDEMWKVGRFRVIER